MKKKILIVEDNEQNLYLMQYMLEKTGYFVVAARTGGGESLPPSGKGPI